MIGLERDVDIQEDEQEEQHEIVAAIADTK
jgi:hypothetical protein